MPQTVFLAFKNLFYKYRVLLIICNKIVCVCLSAPLHESPLVEKPDNTDEKQQ